MIDGGVALPACGSMVTARRMLDSELADEELVAAARSDPGRFAELYDRYCDRVHSYVASRIANPQDAPDITQQTFLDAMRGVTQLRGTGGSFRAWLFRIARNRVADYHRRRKNNVSLDVVPGTLEPADAQDVEADVLRHEALERLGRLVAALEPTHQEMIALRFGAGLSTREVAEVMEKSEAATKQQLYRIVRALKERYDAS